MLGGGCALCCASPGMRSERGVPGWAWGLQLLGRLRGALGAGFAQPGPPQSGCARCWFRCWLVASWRLLALRRARPQG